MSTIVRTSTSTQAAWLEKRLKEHRAQVAQLRNRFGDPEEALSKFIRERFELEALMPKDRTVDEPEATTQADDDIDAW